jgi:pimeloyl-ACP methyl ester carboxylesterase
VADAGLADYFGDALEALTWVSETAGQPVLLVGHSMGGLIALGLACERPAAVAGVFLVDPVYADTGAIPVAVPRLVVALMRVVMGAVARSFLRDGWLGRVVSWPFFLWAFHDANARNRAWRWQREQVPLEYPRMLFESLEGVSGFPFQPFADRVTVPVRLVEALSRPGARSRFTAVNARLASQLGERASSSAVVGGHYLQLDRPNELNAQLLAFARELLASPSSQRSPPPPPSASRA